MPPPVGPAVVDAPVPVPAPAPVPFRPIQVAPAATGPQYQPVWIRPLVAGPPMSQGEMQWPRLAQVYPASLMLATMAAQSAPAQPIPLMTMTAPQPLVGQPQVAPVAGSLRAVQPARRSPKVLRGPRITRQFTCRLCGRLHNRRISAERHIEKEHWGRYYRCLTCGERWFRLGDVLNHHDRTGHEGDEAMYPNRPEGAKIEDQIRSQDSAPRD